MNSMTSEGPVANSVYVMAPHNSYPVMPGVVSQGPLYSNNQPQVHLVPGNLPVLIPAVNVLSAQKVLKEGKVLGAIQILIGLIHFGLGAIMITVLPGPYVPISLYGGFPFWGGISLNSSVGLNIFSAICSAVGVILFITDLSVTGMYHNYPDQSRWSVNIGLAVSGVLLVFCLLECCVASVSSHFGCRLTCCQYNKVDAVIPNVYVTNAQVFPEPPNPAPSYSSVAQGSD